jgi:hypothetical protein
MVSCEEEARACRPRTSVFGTWVPITHYGVGADLPVGPSERASARRVGQEADPYKSGRTSNLDYSYYA